MTDQCQSQAVPVKSMGSTPVHRKARTHFVSRGGCSRFKSWWRATAGARANRVGPCGQHYHHCGSCKHHAPPHGPHNSQCTDWSTRTRTEAESKHVSFLLLCQSDNIQFSRGTYRESSTECLTFLKPRKRSNASEAQYCCSSGGCLLEGPTGDGSG